ncbi:hypothetical protein GCM10007938_37420 [Vibrio zhanjiangensis]|uniref:Proline and glycine rich transmembrane protein gene in bax n=1 Tax=Vibrio zhanjiangensis TaxID=1046128 RepID=A0ABQ6F416_9VIBR|nr:hypothetical protein [Vibrio zhanjiangensis]GLT19959.1 hypothetical protein GCM10007938_37420 [Vibrio zhanjiangensis]
MNNGIEKEFNLGGSVERALSGNYELKASAVLKEAWGHTIKHFLSFSPSIILLVVAQVVIFYVALKLQIGDLSVVVELFTNPESIDPNIVQAFFVANFSYEVVSAPLVASVNLMAMSHAAGLSTKTHFITKGLQFTIPVIIATIVILVMQMIAGMILPFLSMYASLAFSNAILLICEKQISPIQSLLLSLRAVNKKIFVLIGIYLTIVLLFFAGAAFYGLGLILVIPFYFHVKGIIYREMFGIRLKIVTTNGPSDEDDNDNNSQVFNA